MTDDTRGTGGHPPSGPPGVDPSLPHPTPHPPARPDRAAAFASRQSLPRLALLAGFALAFTALGMGIQQSIDGRVVVSAAPRSDLVGSPTSTAPSLEPLTVTGPTGVTSSTSSTSSTSPTGPTGPAASTAPAVPPPPVTDADASAPAVAVHIPRLRLDRSLVDLRVLPDGSMSVPQDADDVGWWADGPRPGGPGATLVAGHVDSKAGPAVFYRLKDLVPGDLVTVDRSDHTSTVFRVVDKVTYTRADFPDDVVYRVTGKPSLHLVTCDGFDPAIGHYGANLVVSAELVSTGPTGGQG